MRSILAILVIGIFFGPIGFPLLLIFWVIGKFNPDLAAHCYTTSLRYLCFALRFASGTKVTVIGREKIPEDRPVLYTSNHRGVFDIVACYPYTKGLCGFVGKKELEKIPVFRIWLRLVHVHFLDREDNRAAMQTIMDGTEEIKNGISMWICPEGTRNKGEGLLEFKGGSFRMADRANAPVVPVAITHADDVLEKHFPWVHATHIVVEFGDPIDMAQLDRVEKRNIQVTVQNIVSDMYEKNLKEYPMR